MDPNANLVEQLRITKAIMGDGTLWKEDIQRLAELVEALDEWLSRGGFLPKRWER